MPKLSSTPPYNRKARMFAGNDLLACSPTAPLVKEEMLKLHTKSHLDELCSVLGER